MFLVLLNMVHCKLIRCGATTVDSDAYLPVSWGGERSFPDFLEVEGRAALGASSRRAVALPSRPVGFVAASDLFMI